MTGGVKAERSEIRLEPPFVVLGAIAITIGAISFFAMGQLPTPRHR